MRKALIGTLASAALVYFVPPLWFTVAAEQDPYPCSQLKCVPHEIVATSFVSYEDAVRSAVEEASKTISKMASYEVIRQTGGIAAGRVEYFEVTVLVFEAVEGKDPTP